MTHYFVGKPRRAARQLRGVLVDEGPLGTYHAGLVALGVGKNGPGLGAGLPDVHPPGTKRRDALDLGLLLAGGPADFKVSAVNIVVTPQPAISTNERTAGKMRATSDERFWISATS